MKKMYEKMCAFVGLLNADTEEEFLYYYRKAQGRKTGGRDVLYFFRRWHEFE